MKSECLTHPAVDDLKIVELKRRKLQVKDEIDGCVKTAGPACTRPLDLGQVLITPNSGRTRVRLLFCWKLHRPLELNRERTPCPDWPLS